MKYFTLTQLIYSDTAARLGLDNTPTEEHLRNLTQTIEELIDPLCGAWAARCEVEKWGSPVLTVTSGYRGYRLKEAKRAMTSAHCYGYALDLVPANGRLAEFKNFCRIFLQAKSFDQLISEDENEAGVPRWVHIGYKNHQGAQRRQMRSKIDGRLKLMTF